VTADPKTIPLASSQEDQPTAMPGDHFAVNSVSGRNSVGARHIWLWRLRALLFVTVCATCGVLLLILPWTARWTDNPLLLSFPSLRPLVASGFARGLSSGLGLLDLWLGFWEAIHYHESSI